MNEAVSPVDPSKLPNLESPIDWDQWQAGMNATLMFVVKDQKILLIQKKRGLGAGKINGPGGKIDPGETALDAAIRETEEELMITPRNPRKLGELWFSMSDCPDIHCHVYRADDFDGSPTETEEAVPIWYDIDAIPYNRMWEDDRHWMHLLLAETGFLGRFVFQAENISWMDVQYPIDWG